MNDQLIEALLIERAGYVQRGLKDRVRQVDEQLHLAGYKSAAPVVETATAEPVIETAARPVVRKRASK